MNNGRRAAAALTHEQALAFASAAADEFGVGSDRSVTFDTEKAKEDLKPKKEKAGKRGKGSKAAAAASEEKSDA